MLPASIHIDHEWVRGTGTNTASLVEHYQNSTYKTDVDQPNYDEVQVVKSESSGPAALKICFWNLYKISK